MSESLSVEVYVAPMRPFVGAAGEAGDQPMWSPMSSTLIYGERDAILVDALVANEQVDALAEWVRGFGKRLVGVYITHGHADHWLGLARLQEHFPEAKGLATAEVAERARFELSFPPLRDYWFASFPGELPEAPVHPEVVEGDSFELEGNEVRILSLGQGDTEHSTALHVPSIGLVVAGDIVYNGVHMMTGETDAEAREAWMRSLDAIEALAPTVLVSGHKRVGASDGPEQIEASRQYLRDFTRIVDEGGPTEQIVTDMLKLHGDRDNPRTLWYSARQAVGKRA
ncbi:MBL fold metallo-hydrolase [Leifsonia sp. NPDC056665]|uniref:MBL fold metallo-hydrolase n=1 Tax=Leifsonia sp. NPDC056665 TaxID=3345901 RepID=UPI0036BBA430